LLWHLFFIIIIIIIIIIRCSLDRKFELKVHICGGFVLCSTNQLHVDKNKQQEAQLSQRDRSILHVIEYVPHCRILSPDKTEWDLSRLHSADDDAVSWLTSYGSWHAYENEKIEYVYFAKSLKVTQYHSKWHPWVGHCKSLLEFHGCDDSDADDVMKSTIMNFNNQKFPTEIYILSETYR